jgi:hypothetical protein
MSSLRNSYELITNSNRGVYGTRELTIDGIQGSDNNLAVNGAATPVDFWYQPAPGDLFRIDVINVTITDNGAPEFDNYGNVAGPLANGTRFFQERGGVRVYSDATYNTNVDWITVATTSEIFDMAVTQRIIVYRAEFQRFASGPVYVGDSGDKFGIQISDDLSTLTLHNCTLTGAVYRGV